MVPSENDLWKYAWSTILLRLYLEESRFTFRTDHNSFRRIWNLTDAREIIPRCWIRLLQFDCDVIFRTGFKNRVADALSRLQTYRNEKSLLEGDPSVITINETENNELVRPLYVFEDISSTYRRTPFGQMEKAANVSNVHNALKQWCLFPTSHQANKPQWSSIFTLRSRRNHPACSNRKHPVRIGTAVIAKSPDVFLKPAIINRSS